VVHGELGQIAESKTLFTQMLVFEVKACIYATCDVSACCVP